MDDETKQLLFDCRAVLAVSSFGGRAELIERINQKLGFPERSGIPLDDPDLAAKVAEKLRS